MTATAPDAGCFVWTRGSNEFGDDTVGGMVVDFGITEAGEQYVIALVPAPSYPKTSPKRRAWLYSRVEGATHHVSYGQVSALRRFLLSDLAPCDGFRDVTKMQGYAAKALLAAGVTEHGGEQLDLLAAHQALSDAVLELNAERAAS